MMNPSPGSYRGGVGRPGEGTVPIGAALTTTSRRTPRAFIAETMARVPGAVMPASARLRGPRHEITASAPINVAFLSGSQRFRVAVSLALGLGQYACRQHRPIESVIIDEGFGCLDRQGRQVMIQELQNLRGQMRCILLVSHQEEFADAFSDGYHFELTNGATQVKRIQK